jgi:hypothetical protein
MNSGDTKFPSTSPMHQSRWPMFVRSTIQTKWATCILVPICIPRLARVWHQILSDESLNNSRRFKFLWKQGTERPPNSIQSWQFLFSFCLLVLFDMTFYYCIAFNFSSSPLYSHYCHVPLQKTSSQAPVNTMPVNYVWICACNSNLASQQARRRRRPCLTCLRQSCIATSRVGAPVSCLISLVYSLSLYSISSDHKYRHRTMKCSERKKSALFIVVCGWMSIIVKQCVSDTFNWYSVTFLSPIVLWIL